MKIVKYSKEHMREMFLQENQKYLSAFQTEELSQQMESMNSWSCVDDDGRVLAIAGTLDYDPGRAVAWCYLADNLREKMVFITRAVKRFLDLDQHRRVEMYVDCDFAQAHRWAAMLGFKMECDCMESFTPDGRDCALYARVKK